MLKQQNVKITLRYMINGCRFKRTFYSRREASARLYTLLDNGIKVRVTPKRIISAL